MSNCVHLLSRHAHRAVVVLAAGCALGAGAQPVTADSDAPPPVPGQVLSDVQPMPAEDRDSHGALVIDGAPVRAQQKQRKAAPKAVVPATIGRGAHDVVERTRSWNDVDATAAEDQVPAGEPSGAGPPR